MFQKNNLDQVAGIAIPLFTVVYSTEALFQREKADLAKGKSAIVDAVLRSSQSSLKSFFASSSTPFFVWIYGGGERQLHQG